MRYAQYQGARGIASAGWIRLQELVPPDWTVREASPQGHGIECRIECGSVPITVQLVETQALEWIRCRSEARTARSPAVQAALAQCWFHRPGPVFLFVAETATGRIFYASVQAELRVQFGSLSRKGSVTLKLVGEQQLGHEDGLALLGVLVARERAQDQFAFHVSNLLSQIPSFAEFVVAPRGLDAQAEVPSERHLQFRVLYESCRLASLYLETGWEAEPLASLYAAERKPQGNRASLLRQGRMEHSLRQLHAVFPRLVRKALALVVIEQSSYWRWRDPAFHALCANGELEWMIDHVEQQLPSA